MLQMLIEAMIGPILASRLKAVKCLIDWQFAKKKIFGKTSC